MCSCVSTTSEVTFSGHVVAILRTQKQSGNHPPPICDAISQHGRRKAGLGGIACATTLTECSRISLNVMTLKVTSSLVNSVQGVPISVTGIARVRNTATVVDIQCGHSSLCKRLLNVNVNKLSTTKRHPRILVVAMTTAKFVPIV